MAAGLGGHLAWGLGLAGSWGGLEHLVDDGAVSGGSLRVGLGLALATLDLGGAVGSAGSSGSLAGVSNDLGLAGLEAPVTSTTSLNALGDVALASGEGGESGGSLVGGDLLVSVVLDGGLELIITVKV